MDHQKREIEKKYLVKVMPADLHLYPKRVIEQGYLCAKPTVRIRKSNDTYYLTIKTKDGIKKEWKEYAVISNEIEVFMSEISYLHLIEKIDGNLIQKTRFLIPLGNDLNAELDVFEGRLEGLVCVEVEFPTITAAEGFIPPYWFGKEVSGDKRYRNSYLSTLDYFDTGFFS